MLGIVEIPDALLEDALARLRTRCSKVDLAMYDRRSAQARLEVEGTEAIVSAFRDHYPDRDIRVRPAWPHVHATLKGQSARFEIFLGQDYDHGDGIEPFDIVVSRPRRENFVERMKQKFAPRHEPELELRKLAPEPEPAKPVKKSSAARELLNRTQR